MVCWPHETTQALRASYIIPNRHQKQVFPSATWNPWPDHHERHKMAARRPIRTRARGYLRWAALSLAKRRCLSPPGLIAGLCSHHHASCGYSYSRKLYLIRTVLRRCPSLTWDKPGSIHARTRDTILSVALARHGVGYQQKGDSQGLTTHITLSITATCRLGPLLLGLGLGCYARRRLVRIHVVSSGILIIWFFHCLKPIAVTVWLA